MDNNTNTLKKRDSNIELLRIVAMLMIVAYHILYHCVNVQLTDGASMTRMNNGMFNYPIFYKKLFILASVAPLGKVGNAVFIIISGYFMIKKGANIDLKNISKKLLMQLAFAAITLTIVSCVCFNLTEGIFLDLIDINAFNNMSWFVGYYFMVILIARLLLNDFLLKIDKDKFVTFLLTIFAITQFSWTGLLADSFASGLNKLITGIFLYSFGGYIQLYDPFKKVRGFAFYFVIIASYVLVYISTWNANLTKIENYIMNGSVGVYTQCILEYDDNYIIPIVIGISLFEIFKRIKIPNIKIINFLGSATFMVYLMHDNAFFYSLWNMQDWISTLYWTPGMFIVKYVAYTLITFGVGVISYFIYITLAKMAKKCKGLFLYEN